jgi:hypothetical protein
MKVDFEVRQASGGGVEVFDSRDGTWRKDWREAGFPVLTSHTVKGIKTVNQKSSKLIELTVGIAQGIDYRIFAPANQSFAITGIVFPARLSDSMSMLAYRAIAPRVFKGPLEVFGEEDRLSLLKFAHVTAGGTDLGTETFKDVNYISVFLPEAEGTWNNLRVSRSERVGRLVEKQLALLKAFAKTVSKHEGFGGLKLEQGSRHGTAPDYADVRVDKVEVYIPLEAILKYAAADITSQQLLDGSYVLVDGDRVAIDLSRL